MYVVKKISKKEINIQKSLTTDESRLIKVGDLGELVSKDGDTVLLYNEKWTGLSVTELEGKKYQGHVWYFSKNDVETLTKDELKKITLTKDEFGDILIKAVDKFNEGFNETIEEEKRKGKDFSKDSYVELNGMLTVLFSMFASILITILFGED